MTKEQKILFYIYKINKIKIERIFFVSTIPIQIFQLIKANDDFKFIALLFNFILYGGISFTFYTIRKKNLKDIKQGCYEGLFSPEEIIEIIETFTRPIQAIKEFLRTKKEEISKIIFYQPQQKNKPILK